MQGHDVIVMGASAGGVEALLHLVGDFPRDLPAAVFIVLHIAPDSPSLLPSILGKRSRMPALSPEDRSEFKHGHIYVAPPDRHLLIEENQVRVLRGPTENRHRPAIDPLFRSAAWSFGPRVVGVVLTGTMDDGAAGLWAVKTCGGVTVVQDPADALFPCMPRNAMNYTTVDHCLPLNKIPALLDTLARKPVNASPPSLPEKIGIEVKAAMLDEKIDDMKKIGSPSVFTCPECNGVLWEIQEEKVKRYRCHVGHSYLPDSLLADKGQSIGDALYTALTAIEEKAAMLRRLAAQVDNKLPKEKARYEALATEQEKQANYIRQMLID